MFSNPAASIGSKSEAILAEAYRLVSSAIPAVLGYLAIMVGVGILVDTTESGAQLALLPNLISIPAGYWLTVSLIDGGGLAPDGRSGGIGIYFALSIVSGFAILFGLLLLLLPGLYLFVRWAPSYGIALVEEVGVTRALGNAWDMTTGHGMPIAVSLLLPAMLFAGGAGAMILLSIDVEFISVPGSIAGNLGMYSGTVAATAIGVAVYSLLAHPAESLGEVFE